MTAPKIDTQAPELINVAWGEWEDIIVPYHQDNSPNNYVLASLSAAREAAAAMAMREAAAKETERGWRMAGQRDGEMMRTQADAIRDLSIPTDPAALDRLIAEARAQGLREAAKIYEDGGPIGTDSWDYFGAAYDAFISAADRAARGSKEGQS